MKHTRHALADGLYHMFDTDKGVVVVRVQPVDIENRVASVSVYERECAIASIGIKDADAHLLPVMDKARNRFGTGRILRILRAVRAASPEVKSWVYERKSGSNAGRTAERAY